MKNNSYKKHTGGKYGYFTKKQLAKRLRQAGKKATKEV